MTAPGQWSIDNPFIDQPQAEPVDTFSDDNPFVEKVNAAYGVVPTTQTPKPTGLQSDVLAGAVAGGGGVVSGVGHFLRLFDLEDASETLVGLGERIQGASEQFGPKVKTYKDISSISDGVDYLQYLLGQGLASTLPGIGGASVGAAVGGKVATIVGAIAPSYIQNTGNIMEEIQKLNGEDRKGLAVALGVPVAIADAVTPVDLVNRILSKQITKAAARSLIKEAGRTGIREAGTELLQEELQYVGTRLGTGKPLTLREMVDRGVDASVGGLVTGGVLGAATSRGETDGMPPQVADPVTLKPTPKPDVEPSNDDVASRQKEVEALAAQEKATAERKAQTRNALLRAANAWNTLTSVQRRTIVSGLADTEYDRRWTDLTPEARTTVRQTLGGDASYTNLDTSQPPGSAPAAQGVGPAVEAGASSTAPSVEQPVGPTVSEEELSRGREVDFMPLPELRAERQKVQSKLTEITGREALGPASTAGYRIEREFYEKYLKDIEDAMEKKLRQPPTKESLDKLTENPPEGLPDIGLSAPTQAELDNAAVWWADWIRNDEAKQRVLGPKARGKSWTQLDNDSKVRFVEWLRQQEKNGDPDGVPLDDEIPGIHPNMSGSAIADALNKAQQTAREGIPTGLPRGISKIDVKPMPGTNEGPDIQPEDNVPVPNSKLLDITGDEEKGFHDLSESQWNQFKQFAARRGLDINSSNYDLSTGPLPVWETLADPNDGLIRAWGKQAFYAVLYDMGVREVKLIRQETPAAYGDIPTVEAIKRAKERVGEPALRKRAQEIAAKAGRKQVTNGDVEMAAREQLKVGEEFTIKLQPPKPGPDAGGQPSLPSGGPAPQAPTGEGVPTPDQGPTPGPEGPIQMPSDNLEEILAEDQDNVNKLFEAARGFDKQSFDDLSAIIRDYSKATQQQLKDFAKNHPDAMNKLSPYDRQKFLDAVAGLSLDSTPAIDRQAVDNLTAPIDPLRMEKIEQSIEDKTQVEKLIKQRPLDDLSGLTLDQLDDVIDQLDKALETGRIDETAFRQAVTDVADAKRAIKAREKGPVGPPVGKIKLPDISKKDLSKTTEDERTTAKRTLASMLQQFPKASAEYETVSNELNRILDFESEQRNKANLKNFLKDEGGELRFPFKRMKWGGLGLQRKAVKKADQSGLPHWEQTIAKKVVLEEDPVNPYSVTDRIRQAYTRIFRQAAPIGSAERLSGKQLPAHLSPYILAQMSSRFLTQAEEYMLGDGPFIPDDQGNFVPTGAMSLAAISRMVNNDVERLGWLALARRELYERAQNNRTIGVDPVAAQLMFVNTPKMYHDAADALAQYHHSLVDYAIWGELVDPKNRTKFSTRFYAPIARVFGKDVGGASETITPRGERKKSQGGENPIKRYRGSTRPIVNPFETSVDWTARIIRASNQNKVASLLVRLARENPQAYLGVLEPASGALRNKIKGELKSKAEAVKARMEEEGEQMTLAEAEHFVGTMGDEALAIRDNVLNVWADGKLEHWVLHPELAYGLKSLSPHELGILTRATGLPANVQRFTIVNDPIFIMTMSMIDTFQAYVNSKYGFTPVIDSFRGWWAAIHNTPEFRQYRQGGGGQSSLTSQRYVKSETSLYDIVGAPTDQSPVAKAIHELKTYHPVVAWKTLAAPLTEAARVGEYLRARGRGASVVEAVFAAKDVTGNYSQQGGAMHALNHMTVFLNPALQVLDKTARVIADNPARWFLKSSILAGAAFVLYMANGDDEEIKDLRQTPGGQRYFFIRMPDGSIGKIRKPFLEGALFASGLEAAMDKTRDENPEAFKLWSQAILQEIMINQLPAIGVIPAQYWANKGSAPGPIDFLFGGQGGSIVPESDQMLSARFQSRATTGAAARIIGKKTGASPVVIEWLARSQFGYLGGNVIAALDNAIEWKQSGELPIPEELPFVNRVLVRYPSSQVRPIREFYERAKSIERVAADLEYMAMNEPEMLEPYIEAHEKELALIDLYKDTRAELAEFRKAIEDISNIDASIIPPSDRRQFSDEFLRIMIEQARAANLTHQAVTEATKTSRNP